jgi:hypothetical protein
MPPGEQSGKYHIWLDANQFARETTQSTRRRCGATGQSRDKHDSRRHAVWTEMPGRRADHLFDTAGLTCSTQADGDYLANAVGSKDCKIECSSAPCGWSCPCIETSLSTWSGRWTHFGCRKSLPSDEQHVTEGKRLPARTGLISLYGVGRANRLAREPLARVRNHDCITRALDCRVGRGLLGRKDISAVIALEKANLRQFRPKLGDAADHGHPASTTPARQRARRGGWPCRGFSGVETRPQLRDFVLHQ